MLPDCLHYLLVSRNCRSHSTATSDTGFHEDIRQTTLMVQAPMVKGRPKFKWTRICLLWIVFWASVNILKSGSFLLLCALSCDLISTPHCAANM